MVLERDRQHDAIKKESPNKGTETPLYSVFKEHQQFIKKESPNEGTETPYNQDILRRLMDYQ